MPMGAKRRASTGNIIGMIVVTAIVSLLIIAMLVLSHTLSEKVRTYKTLNDELAVAIEEEMGRTEELKTLPDYIASDAFIEKTAREKFGLVYADEIIFQAE